MIVKKCEVVKLEAIVRGYITGERPSGLSIEARLMVRFRLV
jgi:phosphoribosylaminoimidazole-succinocarboxamide synthase